MFDEPIVFVDIETSGGSYKTSQIIEIAAIRVEKDEIVKEFQTLVKPSGRIPSWITQITGITNTDVASAPSFEEIAPDLHSILSGAIFAAHNVRFDYSFIKNQLRDASYEFNPKLFCTVRLSRALYPSHTGHSLEKILARHNIHVKARHRAYDDARAIYEFSKIAHSEHGNETFQQAVSKQIKSKTLPPNLDASYLENVSDTPGIYIFKDADNQPIYVGKSINLRKRILSHFSQDITVSKEMKLSLNTHSIKTIETSSELEALLLESKTIKELLPVYNIRLRRSRGHIVFVKSVNEHGYSSIEVLPVNLSELETLSNIYGVFNSKKQATQYLEKLIKIYRLCPKLLGLEKTDRACFNYQLGVCRGACIGIENASVYNNRLEIALKTSRLHSWPYETPMVIPLEGSRDLVIDKWAVAGYIDKSSTGKTEFNKLPTMFDIDTYKIIRTFLSNHTIQMRPYIAVVTS